MRVLIIPEGFRKDQYILKPLFSRLFESMGGSQVRVRVCQNPLLGGVGEALKLERMREVVKKYAGMTDIFILCVDRDGFAGRREQLDRIESGFGDLFAENAWEELETWLLAGLDLPGGWRWRDVRAEVSVKEVYFNVLVRARGLEDGPGGGRKELGAEAARNLRNIRRKCVEDFDTLARRLEDRLRAG